MKKTMLLILGAAAAISLSACAYDDGYYDHDGRGHHHDDRHDDRDDHGGWGHGHDHDGDHDHDRDH